METVNQDATLNNENTQTEDQKTFTQSELDAIVSDRLKRERGKYQDYEALKQKAEQFDKLEEANKTELQKATEKATALEAELNELKKNAEIRSLRDKVAKENGIPAELLSGSTEEECMAQAKALIAFRESSSNTGYPSVRDGGEIHNTNKGTTRQQFADWANKAFG